MIFSYFHNQNKHKISLSVHCTFLTKIMTSKKGRGKKSILALIYTFLVQNGLNFRISNLSVLQKSLLVQDWVITLRVDYFDVENWFLIRFYFNYFIFKGWALSTDPLDLDISYRIHYKHQQFTDVKTISQSDPAYILKVTTYLLLKDSFKLQVLIL